MQQNDKEVHVPLESWFALGVVVIGTFMSILDSSIVNIAIPKMMAVFGISMDNSKWILTSYTLALGAIIPLTGYLQEVFGAKKIYMFALGMFSVGSLLCGFSWSFTTMVIFRVIQAIGGGMIMPVGMTIIYQVFPRAKIGLALGFWGIASMAAPAIGPTLGGYIIEKMDWRLIFNVNVPIGIIGVILAGFILKDTQKKVSKAFDIIGFISSTVGLVSVLYVLGEWSTIDWSKIQYPILLTLGCLSLVLFVVNELTHPEPLLDLRVLKMFDFSLSQVIVSVLTLAMMGGMYVLPIFLQNIKGYTAMQSGLIMLPSALVVGVMMPISGNIFDRIGAKPIVIPGLIILGISSFELAGALNMNSSKETIILITCLRSVGMGLAMMPISTVGMNVIPQAMVGKASALSNTIRQVSSSLSVTIMSVLIQGRTNYNYAKLAEQINIYNKSAMNTISKLAALFTHAGLSQTTAKASSAAQLVGMIQIQATVDAMAYSVAVTAISIFVAIALTFLLKSKKTLKKNKETKQDTTEGLVVTE